MPAVTHTHSIVSRANSCRFRPIPVIPSSDIVCRRLRTDNADRIPINVGYNVARSAEVLARTAERGDGTGVINILALSCDPAVKPYGIVVCEPDSTSQPVPSTDGDFVQGEFKLEVNLAPNVKARARAETEPASRADRVIIDIIYRF